MLSKNSCVVGLYQQTYLQQSRGSAQKHFHTDAQTGRRCESAFALLSHRESNEEVASTGPVW